ncbi:thiolase family protein [Amycolatopsis thermoflava]|uniref:thiolase family protein n=1 Tax=Amycolatopsis thermoflava TaxID=84480 RepID=UPI00380B0BF1
MDDAVIIDAVRSPMGKGKPGGALSGVHPADLLGQVVKALLRRADLDPGVVDDFMVGCVSQAGEQSGNIGRMAWLGAGLPEHVPSVTIERKCGSSQQALDFAAQSVMAGANDVVVVGGVESMSRVPMGCARIGMDPYGPAVTDRYAPGLVSQGVAAELVAARWKLSRSELDAYAVRSHALAAKAADDGAFGGEIVPIEVSSGRPVIADESIRRGTSVEGLAALRPVFADEVIHDRFPEISWSITAGNSSQITDGAAALLVTSAKRAAELGLRPRARFHSFAVAGDDPVTMLAAPIPAARAALKRGGLTVDDIAHFEVNEAFASVPLAWQAELGADPTRVNPRGGAIALGHPLGASGARLMTTMLGALEAGGGRYGLQTMCEAGGMANATVIERV